MIRYIFPYENIITGGAELLVGRMSKRMKSEGHDVSILCKSIDNHMERYFCENGVAVNKVNQWNKAPQIISKYSKEDEINVIVLLWEDFIFFSAIKKKNIKVIFYVVHFQGLAVGKTCKHKYAKYFIKKMAANCINRTVKSGNIVCLDSMTVSYAGEYFGKWIDRGAFKIIRLPVEDISVDEKVLKSRSESGVMNILTISRADFPFKGYLLGTIDFAKKLDAKGENFHLTMISYGEGIETIEKKISLCDKTVRDKITLLGKTDYEELDKYYPNTKLYLGMGTTIVDAALRGIISIPVEAYTSELSVNGFYHENGMEVCMGKSEKNNINVLYDKVKNMNAEEYYKLSKMSRKIVCENCSLDKNVDEFLRLFMNVKRNRFHLDVFFFSCLYQTILKLGKGKK